MLVQEEFLPEQQERACQCEVLFPRREGFSVAADMRTDCGLCLCFEQLPLKIAEGRRRKWILKVLRK